MIITRSGDKEFIENLTRIILANLDNQDFGVKDLERESGTGRSTINQRLRAICNTTISEFIRDTRLQRAKEILLDEKITAAEAAYRVGFSSPAYFNTCFRKYFGYPPGEAKKRNLLEMQEDDPVLTGEAESKPVITFDAGPDAKNHRKQRILLFSAGLVVLLILIHISARPFLRYVIKKENADNSGREKSIAILPFKNIAGGNENEIFAEGVVEEVHTYLSTISDLKVVSRTSAEKFRNSPATIQEIAGQLGVNFILEGSVQKVDDKVRINFTLIDANHDAEILSEIVDQKITNIFEIQSSIARKVAQKLEAVVSRKEVQQIKNKPTEKTEAYSFYIKGRFFLNRMDDDGLTKCINYFEKAIESDASYALAYAGLADAWFIMTWWGNIPREKGFAKAKKLAIDALKLNPDLAEAHAILGRIYCYFEWKWENSEKELIRAIELNPNYSTAYYYYAELLDITGKQNQAIENMNRAIDLDPFSFSYYSLNSLFYYNLGKFDKSLEFCQKALEINPEYAVAHWRYFRIYYYRNEGVKAVESLQKILSLDSLTLKYVNNVPEIYNKSGLHGLIEWLIRLNLEGDRTVHLARFYAMLGKKEEAIGCLENAMKEKVPNFCRLISYYDLRVLFDHPKFNDLVKKAGLTGFLPSIIVPDMAEIDPYNPN